MSEVVRFWKVAVLVAAVAVVPLAAAADDGEQLQVALDLFEKQEYTAAQEVALTVQREELSAEAQQKLENLLQELPLAIQGAEKAAQDLAAADAAYEAGEWAAALALYESVRANRYAPRSQSEHIEVQAARITEKQRLADAAKPTGTLEPPAPVDEPADEPVTPADDAPIADVVPPTLSPPDAPRPLSTPADEMRLRNDLLWQRAVAAAEREAANARTAMAGKDFESARRHVVTALQAIEQSARYADPLSKYEDARAAIVALRDEVDRSARQFQQEQNVQTQEEVAERVRIRAEAQRRARDEKVAQLLTSAEQLRAERRFDEAADVLRQVLVIDPTSIEAQMQLKWAETLASVARQDRWQRDLGRQQPSALQTAEDALIPWDVDVMYPSNWLALSARRDALGVSTGQDLEDVELNRQLDLQLPEVRFAETPFEQVMDFLGELTKVNLVVEWQDLVDAGIERDAPITLQLSNVSFRQVLRQVLSQVGRDTPVAFTVADGLLRIATKEKLDRDKLVLIYDIRDLLVRLPRARQDQGFDVTQGLGQGGGGGGGGGMFGQGNQQQDQGQDDQDPYGGGPGGALVQQIMDIIRQTVEPDSWRETGGGDGSIRDLSGQLIVYNTSDAHRQVADLLSQLRASRALQVSVETRFLNVVANFLEEFGVDLDFVFNQGSAGFDPAIGPTGGVITDPATGAVTLIPRGFSRSGVIPAVPNFGVPLNIGTIPQQPYGQAGFVPTGTGILPQISSMTPITAQQNSLALVTPTIGTGVPGSFASAAALSPALSIAGSFLDNLQVDFLIRATQANQRSSIVQAPRLVLFNGQASTIAVGRSRSYVASLRPSLAEGAVGFEPEIEEAEAGVSIWVEAIISADRKYVTLSLRVQQRDEPTFERFEVQRASGNSPGAFILLPETSFAVVQTTVSIPDGGTVLLGGLKQVGEVEVDAGVPILSKIPVLKRAFSNQTLVKDTRTLLILVKSKIIIQQEAEDDAFPTLTRAPL